MRLLTVCGMSTQDEHLQTDPGAKSTITFKRKPKYSRNRGHSIYIKMMMNFYWHREHNFSKFAKRFFSTSGVRFNIEDHSSKEYSSNDNTNKIKYLKDFKKENNKIKWESNTDPKHMILGKVGEYNRNEYNLKSLLNIYEFYRNVQLLGQELKKLDIAFSYALGVILRNVDSNTNITVDKHFLVNYDTDPEIILQQVYDRIIALSEKYYLQPVDKLFIKLRKLDIKLKNPVFLPKVKDRSSIHTTIPKGMSKFARADFVPHNMDLKYYGVEIKNDKENNIRIFDNGNVILKVKVIQEGINHLIDVLSRDNRLLYQFEDIKVGDTLKRHWINDNMFHYYIDNCLVNVEIPQKVGKIEPAEKDRKRDEKILSFDIETYKVTLLNGDIIMKAYACGFYDGTKNHIYYLSDYSSDREMLLACLMDMLKYDKHTVYCHNFSKFDINFIIQIIVQEFKIEKIISKDLDILSIKFSYTFDPEKEGGKREKKSITIADSCKLIPGSLDELAEAYKVVTKKGKFPYNYVNKDNIDYVGVTPDYKYYMDSKNGAMITLFEWGSMYSNKWSMRDETIKYLKKDLMALYQIMMAMSENTFSTYRINITRVKTASALAFLVYRAKFLPEPVEEEENEINSVNNILSMFDKKNEKKKKKLIPKYFLPKLKGRLEESVRAAYFGGRNEIFIPIINNILSYDFNSLYPTAMMMGMPVGIPFHTYNKNLNEIFGFVRAKIVAPAINIPVLPCRVMVNGVEKLIFPIGQWTGWYFSEELKLAVEYGYQIEVIESYVFEKRDDPFKEYIEHFAAIKDNSEGAKKAIAKLLLNTLYGRTGMKDSPAEINMVSTSELDKIQLTNNVIHDFQVDEDKHYVRYNKKACPVLCEQSGKDYDMLSYLEGEKDDGFILNSTSIAAATASWARILMYKHIINSAYTDTDSIFVEKPLDNTFIGKGCGKFKAEYDGFLIKRAIFVSGKLYLLHIPENKSIGKNEIEVKCKGITKNKDNSTHNLDINDFEVLYNGESRVLFQERWGRKLETGTVSVKYQKYNLISGYDKREKLYSLGKWVSTSPLCINEKFEVISKSLVIYNGENWYRQRILHNDNDIIYDYLKVF
jgi:hypothetical protein